MPRESGDRPQIGLAQVDHRDRATCRRVFQRSRIEIGELLGREQRKTALADRANRQVIGHIIVRGDPGTGADPDRFQRPALTQRQSVLFRQADEKVPHIH